MSDLGDASSLLTISDLSVAFGGASGMHRALDGVSLKVRAGSTLGIVGESGSGKSVLSKAILRILPKNAHVDPRSSINYSGTELLRLGDRQMRQYRGKRIAMIFQDPMTSLNPVRTIGAQISETVMVHLGLSRAAARDRAVELLSAVGLAHPDKRVEQFPHELSGGMRQRVVIAMAISCEPNLLIADEATTALDVTVQAEILELLLQLQRSRKMTMILITHDLGVAANYTDTIAVMYGGQLLETGPTRSVFTEPKVPYTRALLEAIPRLADPSHSRLKTIPGRARRYQSEEVGCHFAERCPSVSSQCQIQMPPFAEVAFGHNFRCWNS